MRKLLPLLCLLLGMFSANAQPIKLAVENYDLLLPEGNVHFVVKKDKMVIKFRDGYPEDSIAYFFRSSELFKAYQHSWHYPFPDVIGAEINTAALPYTQVLQQIQNNNAVLYTAPVLLYGEQKQEQALFDQFYVKVKTAGDLALLKDYAKQLKFEVVKEYEKNIYRCKVTKASSGNSFEISRYLQLQHKFDFAEPDFIYTCKLETNDPFYTSQWAINNTGQFSGTPGADMDVANAWTITTGNPTVKVAVLDCFGSAAEFIHPDITFAATHDATGSGFISSGFNGDAHGINCAGIIGATGNNFQGIAGVAYSCGVAAVKLGTITNSSGNWNGTSTSISDGITWAYQNCDVISNSNTFGSSSSIINSAISNALTLGRGGKGTLFFSSSGNSNTTTIGYPASNSNTIAVGASSMCDQRKSPSSCDGETWWGADYGTGLDVVAPGVKIYSTDIAGSNGYSSGDYTPNFNGTSSACPMAAAVAALLISANGNLTATSVRTVLETNCEKVGGYTYNTGVSGQPNGSWNNQMGYGRINAFNALQAICTTPSEDICGNTILVPGVSCNYTPGNLCGASQSIPPSTCSGWQATSALDVWYDIIPTLGSVTINCQSGTNTDVVLGIYSGACTAPVLVQCVDASSAGGLETLNVSGLTPLNTYHIRVYDWNSNLSGTDFQICVQYSCSAPTVPVVTPSGPITICQGQSTTLTVSNPCSGCTFNWSNSGTGTTQNITAGGSYTVTATNACGTSAASNSVTVNVNPLPVTPVVTPSGPITICQGQSTTLTVSNPCSGCTFAWSGGGTGTTKSITATSTNTVTAQNSCGTSASSNAVNVNVTPLPVTPIVTPAGPVAICQGQSATLTISNPCSGCTFAWSGGGTGTTKTVTTAANYNVTAQNTCGTSATSNVVAVTVNAVVPTVSVTASPSNVICAGTPVTFTAAITNGGANPVYQWKRNGLNVGTNSNTYTIATLNNNDQVSCELTSTATCAVPATVTSNLITMTVNPNLTPTISVSANPGNTICAGTPVTFSAAITNGGSSPTYQWKKNSLNVGTNSSSYTDPALNNGDLITCVLTSNATCLATSTATSNTITMVVNPNLTPAVSISSGAGSSVCAGTNVVFTASPTNGGSNPSYQWKKNNINVGSNSNTYTDNTLNNGDIISCVLTSNATCLTAITATSNLLTMSIAPNLTPTISITAIPGDTACIGLNTTFTANITNGGATPAYQWKKNGINVGTNTNTYIDNTLATNDQVSCVLTSSATCVTTPNATSNTITMFMLPTVLHLTSITASPGIDVGPWTPVTFTATVLNGGTAPAFQWRKNGVVVGNNSNTYTTANLQTNDEITVEVTSNETCANPQVATSNKLTITINTGIEHMISISDFAIYPNPSEGVLHVKGTLSETPDAALQVQVINAVGQVVYSGEAAVAGHKINKEVKLGAHLANGMYLLQLHLNGETIQKRFVLDR